MKMVETNPIISAETEEYSLPSRAWPVYFLNRTLCLQQDCLDLGPITES